MKARYPVRPRTDECENNPGEGDGGGKVLYPAEEKDDDEEPDVKRQRREDQIEGEPDKEVEEEAREVHGPPIPATPSLEEVRKHRLTHRPFRSWCPHCVRGKGRADPQLRNKKEYGMEYPRWLVITFS